MYGMPGTRAYTPDIVSIDVYSMDDFDSAHPAGSSLNDCITFEFESAKDFIESGYADVWQYKRNYYPNLRRRI